MNEVSGVVSAPASVDRIIDLESFSEYSANGIAEDAALHESAGAGGFWSVERMHDPFLPLAYASTRTSNIDLGTSIAIALARSPMTVAYAAHDLHVLSGGRFILGLGPQHQSHVANRFSMPADRPVRRMREYVNALRAIWDSWNSGRPLAFRGEFYTHTLMPPFVCPPSSPFGPPKVFLAAVGVKMAELAGEVADGVIPPPFATPQYLEEVLLPAVHRGLAKSGRDRDQFTVMCVPMAIVGSGADERSAGAAEARLQLAQYSSPADARRVFELHGMGGLGDRVTDLFLSGGPDRLNRMRDLVSDETLELFTVSGEHHEIVSAVRDRFAGLADRIAPKLFTASDDRGALAKALRCAGMAGSGTRDTPLPRE